MHLDYDNETFPRVEGNDVHKGNHKVTIVGFVLSSSPKTFTVETDPSR